MSGAAEWQSRLDAYQLTKADLDALDGDYSDEEGEFYSAAHWAALDALLITPAPHVAAFARKVRIFIAEDVGGWTHSDKPAAALNADALRFEGATP